MDALKPLYSLLSFVWINYFLMCHGLLGLNGLLGFNGFIGLLGFAGLNGSLCGCICRSGGLVLFGWYLLVTPNGLSDDFISTPPFIGFGFYLN